MNPARRLTPILLAIALLAAIAAAVPFMFTDGPGPTTHISVRGEEVTLHGHGPYRHMPADVAVQGLAQDTVTLGLGVPLLLVILVWARRGSRAAHLALTGVTFYLFVQYFLYLAMATYNELFLLWVALLLLTAQALARLLLFPHVAQFEATDMPRWQRRFVGAFLLVNGTLIALLWLGTIVPPLIAGTLYPPGLAHLTTMIVQGFDLALFLPPSLLAGYWYLRARAPGGLLAPAYCVFLVFQMTALLAKIAWMTAIGAPVGPALVIIPLLLAGALAAAWMALRPHGARTLD